ncbi:MAG: PAS domain S-box protein [Pseudomonadales bacterium]|nr:PAS domain S-box protein [Pseudomonadales bacterium]
MGSVSRIFSSHLARRMVWSVLLASISIIAVSASLYLYALLNTDLVQIEKKVEEMGRSHLSSISERVWVADIDSLKLDLIGIQRLDAVQYVSVTENGRVLAEVGTLPTDNLIEKNFPINYSFQGKELKIAKLSIVASSTDFLDRFFSRAISAIAVITMQIFLVSGLVLVLFNRNVTRHLRDIADFAGRIELSNIDQTMTLDRRKKRSEDELDILLAALTSMQHQLNQSVTSLRESEENLSLTLDCIGDAVIATDFEGSIARMNPVAEQLTGWVFEDAIGKNIKDIFPIIDTRTGQQVENPVDAALSTGKVVTLNSSASLIAKNGEQYQVADSAAPIKNNLGDIIGGILVFHDVTDQYQMMKNLREAEMWLKLHIEQTPLGVISWGKDFRVIDWNPAAEKIFGYSSDEAVGQRYRDLIVSPVVEEGLEQRWDDFIGGKEADKFLLENITKKGENLYCEWYNTPLLDDDDVIVGVASLVLNVTERIETEQALAQHRVEQEMLLDYMLDAMISTDSDGLILSFNHSAEQMFGYKESEVIGKELRIVLPEEGWPLYDRLINQPIKMRERGTRAKIYEVTAINKSGQKFPIRFSIGVPPKQGNSIQTFIYSLHDLTGEKEKEEQLRHSQKMEALGKLTGGIAHDYNNMLGIILGYTELLNMVMPEDSSFREYVDKIEQAGQRGVVLTKKMLSLSSRQAVEASPVDINRVLNEQREMLQKTLTARVSVDMKLSQDLWMVWIDEGDFSDVILNLSINAMHAMESVGTLTFESLNVSFAKTDDRLANVGPGDYVLLQVSDTGSGMNKETLERIFDPFFTTKGEKGSGLGLSQVYGFVERSGGVINVESAIDMGTCFSIYFPRYIPEQNVLEEIPDHQNDTALFGRESILVVDDETELLEMVTKMLTGYGYKVYDTVSASSALEILSKHHIDIVLSDVVMPEMDGYELAYKIKDKYPGLPIQLVSGFNEAVKLDRIDEQLQEHLISKPYRSQVVLERIRKLLDG